MSRPLTHVEKQAYYFNSIKITLSVCRPISVPLSNGTRAQLHKTYLVSLLSHISK